MDDKDESFCSLASETSESSDNTPKSTLHTPESERSSDISFGRKIRHNIISPRRSELNPENWPNMILADPNHDYWGDGQESMSTFTDRKK